MHIEARLPPQAWVDGHGRLFLGKKAVRLEAPDHPALRVGDLCVFQRAEKAARGIVEIGGVGERQRLQHCRLLRDDRCGGFLGGFFFLSSALFSSMGHCYRPLKSKYSAHGCHCEGRANVGHRDHTNRADDKAPRRSNRSSLTSFRDGPPEKEEPGDGPNFK